MKEYKLILKLLLKNSFRASSKGKSKVSQWLIAGLSMLPMLVLICVMLWTVSVLCAAQGIFQDLVACAIAGTQLFTFFFAVQAILTTLYLSDDNAFLSSLPASPTSVYFAKMTQIYLGELMISGYVLLPSLITMAVAARVSGYAVFPAFYPLIIPIVLLTPVLPLAVATLLSMPLMWLSRFFKKRAAVGTVVSLLLFAVLFGAYYAVIPNLGSVAGITELSGVAVSAMTTISNVFYPDKVVVYTALNVNGWVNLGISIAIYVGLFALILVLSRLFYGKAVAAQLETGSHNAKKKEESYKSHSKVTALMTRDIKSVVRFPGLALSSFMNVILAPIMLVVMFLYTGDAYSQMIPGVGGADMIGSLVQIGLAFLYSVMLNSGINSTAGLSFTRDGQAFYIMKHLPIDPKDAIKAKLYLSVIVSAAGIVPLILIAGLLMKIGWISSLLFGLCLLLISCAFDAMGVYLDMRRPNLDWKDMSEIQRNNYYMLLPFVLCLVLGIGLLVLACTFSALGSVLGTVGALGVFWAIAVVISLALAGSMCYVLMNKGVALYLKMGENKIVPKAKNKIKTNKSGFLG